jgi:hypothetical protein
LGDFIAIFFFLKISSYIESSPPPASNCHKNHSLRKAKSVEKLGEGRGTRYMLEAEIE